MSNAHIATPTTTSERIVGLDVLRGFALYGVFLVNAFVSARPLEVALKPPTGELANSISGIADLSAELIAWGIFDLILVTKFVTLFSLLFGVGLILQSERAEAKGLPFTKIYRRRLMILAAIGLIHGCLIFEGDILLVYSVVGAILFLFRNQSPKVLLAISMIPFGIGILLSLAWAMLDLENLSGSASAADPEVRPETISQILAIRPINYLAWLVISSLISFNWRVAAFFFMGAAIMKFGWVKSSFAIQQRNAGLILSAFGLAIGIAGLYCALSLDQLSIGVRVAKSMADEFGSVALSLGFAGIVLWLSHSGRVQFLQLGLAAVGRTALTNYLLQSVVINILFMSFAMGLYERISRVEVLVLISIIFVVQTMVSHIWLNYFNMGPVEWLWRWLTYRGLRST